MRTASARLAPWCLLLGLAACDDPAPPPAPVGATARRGATAAPRVPTGRVRLIYAPGDPLAVHPTAVAMRRRLGPLGVAEDDIHVGGEEVHVDVPADKAGQVQSALAAGRLDVHLFDDGVEPPKPSAAAEAQGVALETETVRGADGAPKAVHFLTAPADAREPLAARAAEAPTGATILLGRFGSGSRAGDAPAEAPRLRAYYAQAGERLRGELLTTARVASEAGKATLALGFDGAGKTFLGWKSREHARFLVLVDGEVVGASQPRERIGDGTLAVPIDAAGAAAALPLGALDGGKALSHAVAFLKRRDL